MVPVKIGKPCSMCIASEGLIRTARRQKIKPDRKEREKKEGDWRLAELFGFDLLLGNGPPPPLAHSAAIKQEFQQSPQSLLLLPDFRFYEGAKFQIPFVSKGSKFAKVLKTHYGANMLIHYISGSLWMAYLCHHAVETRYKVKTYKVYLVVKSL